MMASRLLRCLKTRANSLISHRNLSQTLTPTPNRSPFALLAFRPFSSHPIDTSPLPFHSSTQIDNKGFRWDLKEFDSDQGLWALYERWQAHFHLPRPPEEKLERVKIFKENIREIVNHNRRRPDPEYSVEGLNEFADSNTEKGYPFFPGEQEMEMVYVNMQLQEAEEIRDEKGRKQVVWTYTLEDWGDDDCYGPCCCFE